jgi:ribosomal protein L16 Arg81 hydroxylase
MHLPTTLVSSLDATAATPSKADRFQALLGALPAREFVDEYLGRKFAVFPGAASRFGELLDWDSLNAILQTTMFTDGSIRLKKAGKDIPPQVFMKEYTKRNRPPMLTAISAKAITAEMRDGATLIVNSIQKMSPAIRALAEDLEVALRARINVNMYASVVNERNCFPCHYDVHDVLVLQVHGRKHWQVFGRRPITPYPHEPFNHTERPPSDQPVWEGLLTQGDAMYLPRGVWHFARPVSDSTIHLSVGIVKPTGFDFLDWMAKQLNPEQFFRQNLPEFTANAAQQEYLLAFKQRVADWLTRPDLFDAFALDYTIAEGEGVYTTFGLPWSVTEQLLPRSHDALIHLTTPLGLRPQPSRNSDGMVDLYESGEPVLSFKKNVTPLCEYLLAHAPVSIEAFMNCFKDDFSEATLTSFLRELVLKYLIVMKSSRSEASM